MVLADDVGWNQVGYQSSHSKMSTPRIDALALAGVRLERMYSHFICAPSRAALQSGRSAHHVHLQNSALFDYVRSDAESPPEWGYVGVPPLYEGLGSVMKRGGYYSYMLGKWHCGMSTPKQTPAGRGYDEAFIHFSATVSGWTFENQLGEGLMGTLQFARDDDKLDLWESGPDISPREGRLASSALNDPNCDATTAATWNGAGACVHMDDRLANRAEAIIAAHPLSGSHAKPLFLFLAPHSKHLPHDEPMVLE